MSMRELLPMRCLLQEVCPVLNLEICRPSLVRSTVFEDNQGCLSLVNVPKMSPRNKYIALKYHFFREHIGEEKGIVAKYIRSEIQKADIFTKGLPEEGFQRIRKLLMGWYLMAQEPSSPARECDGSSIRLTLPAQSACTPQARRHAESNQLPFYLQNSSLCVEPSSSSSHLF